MAVTFIYGPPGGGKTYYAVNDMLKRFYSWNEKAGRYFLKKKFKDLKIVTNIDSFSPEHEDLDQWIRKAGGKEKFFSLEFQEKVHEKYPSIVYLIDECHKYFRKRGTTEEMLDWVSEHRHLGQSVYCMSQAYSRVNRELTDQLEIAIYAVPRSLTIFAGKELKYNHMSGRERVRQQTIKKSSRVFAQYKSQSADEAVKVGKPMMKYLIAVGCCVLFAVWKFVTWQQGMVNADDTIANEEPSTIEIAPIEIVKEVPKEETVSVPLSYAKTSKGIFVIHDKKLVHLSEFKYPVMMTRAGDMVGKIPKTLHDKITRKNQPEGSPAISSGSEPETVRQRYSRLKSFANKMMEKSPKSG